MSRYVALLRGINVGGRNIIRMGELKSCFEGLGFRNVSTYIQSGNVLFSSRGKARGAMIEAMESALSTTFNYPASVVLRSEVQLRGIVKGAPPGFGSLPQQFRYDVIFLKEPLKALVALEGVPILGGVDSAHEGNGVIYFSRLISRATQSRLSKIVSLPAYRNMTIRNWNTTTKLVELLGDED